MTTTPFMLVSRIAALVQDGEVGPDAEPFKMTRDDAVNALNALIGEARELMDQSAKLAGSRQWDGDGDMAVDVLGTDDGKRSRDLVLGDVFREYGEDNWMKVVGDDTSESDTTIIRVIDVEDPDSSVNNIEADPTVIAASTLSTSALVEAAGEAAGAQGRHRRQARPLRHLRRTVQHGRLHPRPLPRHRH